MIYYNMSIILVSNMIIFETQKNCVQKKYKNVNIIIYKYGKRIILNYDLVKLTNRQNIVLKVRIYYLFLLPA